MNVRYFLGKRLTFLRQLYSTSCAPYIELKRAIEAEEEPYTPKYYDDSGEPQYLNEWLEADESIQVLGRACISMLASALHLYFKEWHRIIGMPVDESLKPYFKKSWLEGYKAYFEKYANVPFNKCSVSLTLLEELVLVRNRVQHPESIAIEWSNYTESDLKKISHPFFIDEEESKVSEGSEEGLTEWLTPPTIRVTEAKFEDAIRAVEEFASWLETVEADPEQLKN
jgi:hypothetical protein